MKEIKFRALINYSPPADIGPPWWEYYGTFDQPPWLCYANISVMDLQFTGLKDLHGKEIYGGDIIKWGHHCERCKEHPIRIAEVKIDPDIQYHSQVGIFHQGNFAYSDTHNHIEVIGNIYENPELLEVTP